MERKRADVVEAQLKKTNENLDIAKKIISRRTEWPTETESIASTYSPYPITLVSTPLRLSRE